MKESLDRLNFASQVSNVQSAFGATWKDAADEAGSYASKATETVAIFQAAQYAAKWMPIDTKLSMKPTYIKVGRLLRRFPWYFKGRSPILEK